MAHTPDADHGHAVFPGQFYRVLHAHFGGHLTGGIIGMQNTAAGAVLFKGEGGMTIGSAF